MPPLVSVVVLTWNQCDLTLECLESLGGSDFPNYEIIVVDNASTDGTSEIVGAQFPMVKQIRNERNLGYAEGNNVGIRQALANGADYVMLLNNDTVVHPRMLSALVWAAEARSPRGIVGPVIYRHGDSGSIWSAGCKIDWHHGRLLELASNQDVDLLHEPYEVDYVSGCALCIGRDVIERIGLIDPRFFIYFEETDWCARARAAGFRAFVVPEARIWHKVSAAMGASSPATVYYMTRNLFLFLQKNTKGRTRLQALITSWIREVRTVAAHSLKPQYRYLRAQRKVRVLALRDALLGRWGRMPSDVERMCHQGRGLEQIINRDPIAQGQP
jgi:GT2 family glycosyltransferase